MIWHWCWCELDETSLLAWVICVHGIRRLKRFSHAGSGFCWQINCIQIPTHKHSSVPTMKIINMDYWDSRITFRPKRCTEFASSYTNKTNTLEFSEFNPLSFSLALGNRACLMDGSEWHVFLSCLRCNVRTVCIVCKVCASAQRRTLKWSTGEYS